MLSAYRAALRSYARPLTLLALSALALSVLVPLLVALIPPAAGASSRPSEAEKLALSGAMNGMAIAVCGGFLTLHLKNQIARPRAGVVPRFRETHIAVGLAVVAVVTLLLVGSLCAQGANAYGAATWLLAVLAAVLWICHVQPWLIGFAGAILMVWMSDAALRGLGTILRAEVGFVGVLLLVGALVGIRAWALRLLRLSEECFEYRVKLVVSDEAVKEQRRQVRANEQIGVASKLDRLTGYVGDHTWRRVGLWRLGNSSVVPWAGAIWFILLSGAMFLLMTWKMSSESTPLLHGTFVFSLIAFLGPFLYAVKALERGCGLDWESLRPCSKAQFLRELGLAAATDALEIWIALVIGCVIISVIWVRELISAVGLALLFLSAGGLVFILGITAWLASFRSDGAKVISVVLVIVLGAAPGVMLDIWPALSHWLPAWLAVALVTSAGGLALARTAHRKWCETELG